MYGIKFGEIGVASQVLEDIQRVFKYRHKLIHVSALPGILNQEKVPPEEPIFLNKAIAEKAKGDFQEFIDKLHKATFELRG